MKSYTEPNRFSGKNTILYDETTGREVRLVRVHEYSAFTGNWVFQCYRIDANGTTVAYADRYNEALSKGRKLLRK